MASEEPEFLAALEPGGEGTLVRVKVVPGSSRDVMAGMLGDRIKVRVAAPPEQGRANEAVIRLLAETIGVPKGGVRLISGASRPMKTFLIEGMDPASVAKRLRTVG